MRVFHLTFSTQGRTAGWPSDSSRLQAVHAIVQVCGEALVAFCVVDDHVHVLLFCDRRTCGRLRQALFSALRAVSAGAIQPAHVTEATRRKHQEWLLDYMLIQPEKHGLRVHPALWIGGCAADLLGARALGLRKTALAEMLPRVHEADILDRLGLGRAPLEQASVADLRQIGLHRVARAVADAAGVDLRAASKRGAGGQARVVLARWGVACGWPAAEVATCLAVTPGTIRRASRRALSVGLERAALRRVALIRRVDHGA